MKKLIIFILLIVAAIVLYRVVYTTKTPTGAPIFTWSYTPIDDQDFPKTHVTLTATYKDGTTISKDIDTPDGSCNEYQYPDTDLYTGSKEIICYAAGLGHYYKIVQQDTAYIVLRKTFEEGSPEYNPLEQPFQEITRF